MIFDGRSLAVLAALIPLTLPATVRARCDASVDHLELLYSDADHDYQLYKARAAERYLVRIPGKRALSGPELTRGAKKLGRRLKDFEYYDGVARGPCTGVLEQTECIWFLSASTERAIKLQSVMIARALGDTKDRCVHVLIIGPEGRRASRADATPPPGSCSQERARKLFLAGDARLTAGDAAGARAQFERALECDPTFVNALRGLGHAHAALGETARALAAYQRYVGFCGGCVDREDIQARMEALRAGQAPSVP